MGWVAPLCGCFFSSPLDFLGKSEKVRGVWIGEDVGTAAKKNTKIAEDTVPITAEGQTGSFILSRPTKGWPVS